MILSQVIINNGVRVSANISSNSFSQPEILTIFQRQICKKCLSTEIRTICIIRRCKELKSLKIVDRKFSFAESAVQTLKKKIKLVTVKLVSGIKGIM